jgi:hypothetical protein
MRYRGALTVPAGTAAETPATEVVKLCAGTITEVEVFFPAGQAGLVSLQVWYHEGQIYPTSPDQAFIGDDSHITYYDDYPVEDAPYEVTLVGWSPDAELDHTVYVDFSVSPLADQGVSLPGFITILPGGEEV